MTKKEIAAFPNHIDTPKGKLYKRKTCYGTIYLLNSQTRGYHFGTTAFYLQDAVDKFIKHE